MITPATPPLTQWQKVLLAADALELQTFRESALIVQAWRFYHTTFGLKGHVNTYPDANKVRCCLMGEKGLVNRGYLIRIDPRLYQLTATGRAEVQRLQGGGDPTHPAPPVEVNGSHGKHAGSPCASGRRNGRSHAAGDGTVEPAADGLPQVVLDAIVMDATGAAILEPELDRLVQTMLNSTIWQDGPAGRRGLRFEDACRLWNISDHMRQDRLEERLREVNGGMLELDRVTAGGRDVRTRRGRLVRYAEIKELMELHTDLQERFAEELGEMLAVTGSFQDLGRY